MENKFREGADIEELRLPLIQLEQDLEHARQKLLNVASQLSLDSWSGETKDGCVAAHEAVLLYHARIAEICTEINTATFTLINEVSMFDPWSDSSQFIWGLGI